MDGSMNALMLHRWMDESKEERLYGIRYIVTDNLVREETRCHHFMGYSFRLAARDVLYAPSHRLN